MLQYTESNTDIMMLYLDKYKCILDNVAAGILTTLF